MRSRDLSPLQLEIAMHLANGKTLIEIATTVDRSVSYVKQQSNKARRKTNARTLPQFVSLVIANGQLSWDGERHHVNGSDATATP